MTNAYPVNNGWVCGPYRKPTNNSQHEAGTIHDDKTARDLGFRSGTIAGSIHMEQFLPLCESVFGSTWQRNGALSCYFLNPSIDGEPVQAKISHAEASQRRVEMFTKAGLFVLEGTASIGGRDDLSCVRARLQLAQKNAPAQPRILAHIDPNFAADSLPTIIPQADINQRLSIITEPRAEFTDHTIYGKTVAPLSAAIHAMRVFESRLQMPDEGSGEYVGMFGAIEWQYINGPVYADTPYVVSGNVLAIGESPKTEMIWVECLMVEPVSGLAVARMLMLSRILKASSSLWCDS
jgi:hypothetical protein